MARRAVARACSIASSVAIGGILGCTSDEPQAVPSTDAGVRLDSSSRRDAQPSRPRLDGSGGSDGGAVDAGPADARVGGGGPDAGEPYPVQRTRPYPEVAYPEQNPYSADKAVLGKILFWEEQLSSDDSTACGTCHRPAAGGSDPRAVESRHPGGDGTLGTDDDPHGGAGIPRCAIGDAGAPAPIDDPVFGLDRQVTRRKPPTYLDAMFAPRLFWDGRAEGDFVDPETGAVVIEMTGALESQALVPILSDSEMACEGRTWSHVLAKLERVAPLALATDLPPDIAAALGDDPSYPDLFERAFGNPGITPRRIALSIATHERTLVSDQTPWDRWNAGDDGALTESERRGYSLFMGIAGCGICHSPPLFSDPIFHNLGFEHPQGDKGFQETTGNPAHESMFRTATVRNAALREPGGLLHDGNGPGESLEELISAYAIARQLAPNTSSWIRPFNLEPREHEDLRAFIRRGLVDPRVAHEEPPFDRPTLRSERR